MTGLLYRFTDSLRVADRPETIALLENEWFRATLDAAALILGQCVVSPADTWPRQLGLSPTERILDDGLLLPSEVGVASGRRLRFGSAPRLTPLYAVSLYIDGTELLPLSDSI